MVKWPSMNGDDTGSAEGVYTNSEYLTFRKGTR